MACVCVCGGVRAVVRAVKSHFVLSPQSSDLRDLFTLGKEGKAETTELFDDIRAQMQKAEEAERAKERQELEEKEKEKGKEKAVDDDDNEAEGADNEASGGQDEAKSKSEKDDAFILRSLFDNANVQGAVCHDSIVEKAGHEQVIIEEQGTWGVCGGVCVCVRVRVRVRVELTDHVGHAQRLRLLRERRKRFVGRGGCARATMSTCPRGRDDRAPRACPSSSSKSASARSPIPSFSRPAKPRAPSGTLARSRWNTHTHTHTHTRTRTPPHTTPRANLNRCVVGHSRRSPHALFLRHRRRRRRHRQLCRWQAWWRAPA